MSQKIYSTTATTKKRHLIKKKKTHTQVRFILNMTHTALKLNYYNIAVKTKINQHNEASSSHAPNTIPSIRKHKKQPTTNNPNHQRKPFHNLIHLLLMTREQTARDPAVRKRYGQEHQGRHTGVDEIRKPEPVPFLFRNLHFDTGLEHGQPVGGDEPVVDPPVRPTEAVREVEEEAGERAQGEQGGDHEGGDVGAGAAATVDGGDEGLEGEEGAGGEEVGEE
ncbi:hypothetical protein RHGRI_034343 [Rhododendron griersonianum]|uniref:Uncharacterized protein n=1 Tax=Rhododendron griersonianum TaxID=479676 RepID=A0AAV6I0C2_9ERIC|nr:hypothetical protein RHGRI_034343 [Rhododendron griersonianum]